MGRSSEGRGSQKTCLRNKKSFALRGFGGLATELRMKNGIPGPDDSGPGIFFGRHGKPDLYFSKDGGRSDA
jgi:hypothetical protein